MMVRLHGGLHLISTVLVSASLLQATCTCAAHEGCDSNEFHPPDDVEFVVVTTTFFHSRTEVRLNTSLRTLNALAANGIPAVVVDSSTDPSIRQMLREAGTASVYEQTGEPGKGPAIRQAVRRASEMAGVGPDTFLCFQEPEKLDMVAKWADTLRVATPSIGVVAPFRTEPLFGETYPKEQWYSENFGNSFLNAAAKEHGPRGLPQLDWFFGPMAFRARHASWWIDYEGVSYDAQLVPLVLAARAGVGIASSPVDFVAAVEMKREEEGSVAFVQKRMRQLSSLAPTVALALEGR